MDAEVVEDAAKHAAERTLSCCGRFWKEFRDFALRGNVLDLAIGLIIGNAFQAIVKSLVEDIIMPPVGLALGSVEFTNIFIVLKQGKTSGPYHTLSQAEDAGAVTMKWGNFLQTIVHFIFIAFCLFLIVYFLNRAIKRMMKNEEESVKGPSDEIRLLTDIRDLLAGKSITMVDDEVNTVAEEPKVSVQMQGSLEVEYVHQKREIRNTQRNYSYQSR